MFKEINYGSNGKFYNSSGFILLLINSSYKIAYYKFKTLRSYYKSGKFSKDVN